MNWRSWWEALVGLVFPGIELCNFCSKETDDESWRGICSSCGRAVMEVSTNLRACPRCGYFSAHLPCPNCDDWDNTLQRIMGVIPYDGMYRELMYCLKYGGKKELAVPLGHLMARKVRQAGLQKIIGLIVPVPLHPGREQERGYNQSALLAREIGSELGITCAAALDRVNYERKQTGLSRRERKVNLQDAFRLKPGWEIKGKTVLLVDDIVTTGSTLSAAARCLRQDGGAGAVFGLTWAAGSDYQQNFEYLSN